MFQNFILLIIDNVFEFLVIIPCPILLDFLAKIICFFCYKILINRKKILHNLNCHKLLN